ncbi:MAG: hypothetical protein IT454_18710 [Planctomycetes bacterium]|nr:hypothetical protein [Planctomycetota bacterium]
MIRPSAAASLFVLAQLAHAQWNPPNAQWGKPAPSDVRVMSWNVQDALCSTNAKVEGNNNWTAAARVVAALRPDVLFVSEAGDNSGNGSGSNVDSVSNLTTTLDDFLHGGSDSFHGNTPVTAFVQKYAPSYDLPYVFVSSSNDGFNRNVVLSRFPFADLNGDSRSTLSDVPTVSATAWAPGGNGGIRGFLFVELDLPDALYAGDLVLGGAHLKAGSNASDHTQRITAAQNVSYVVRAWFNGNGGNLPDPAGRIADSPPATSVLDATTAVVLLGDWNEDELQNGSTNGPVAWLSQAQTAGGTSDGTDRDGTDMTYDSAVHAFSGNRQTIGTTGTKFDYVAWQDSVVSASNSSVFDSASNPASAQPPELSGFAGGAAGVTARASDHRPVFVDLVLPSAVVDCNANGIADALDIANGTSFDTNANGQPDECEPCGTLVTYCTAGTSTNGCNAMLAASGVPSVAQASGFTLSASNVEGQKTALVFYGLSGPKAALWAPGSTSLLCVKSPTQRTPAGSTGGTSGACDGSFALDVLAYLAAHPNALGQPLSAGDLAWFQVWYRDPPAPSTTNLSNALQLSFCP